MIREGLIDAVVPPPDQIFDLIVAAENYRKIGWTAGRVLKEAAPWKQVEELDYAERKMALKRVKGILEELALKEAFAASRRTLEHRLRQRDWI
jgi:hypothetical protein